MSDTSAAEVVAPKGDAAGVEEAGPKKFRFPSHHSHMVNLAKMCQENKEYTDCVIQCGSGKDVEAADDTAAAAAESNGGGGVQKLRAHRLVLGAVSPFMKLVFSEVPPSLPEATILVPGVKRRVVKALLDFLYTGEMTVKSQDTAELQLLIETLQINPDLISVDVVGDDEEDDNDQNTEEAADKQPEVIIEKVQSDAKNDAKDDTNDDGKDGEKSEEKSESDGGTAKKRKLDEDESETESKRQSSSSSKNPEDSDKGQQATAAKIQKVAEGH